MRPVCVHPAWTCSLRTISPHPPQIAVTGARLEALGRESALAPFAAGADVRATWAALLPDRRRAVIAAVWTITLLPSGRGNRVFRTETVRLVPRG